jgi:hypothetical protein
MESELKHFVSSVGVTESVIGVVLVVVIFTLLQSVFSGHSLKHIPRVRDELGRKKLLQEYVSNAIALHREGYQKVGTKLLTFAARTDGADHSSSPFSEWQPMTVQDSIVVAHSFDTDESNTGDHVMIPYHLLDDIKSKKEDEVDNLAAMDFVCPPLKSRSQILTSKSRSCRRNTLAFILQLK